MTENDMPQAKLFAALAKLQAELPRVGKGETGKVEGQTKDGRQFSYSYKYADLADVSQAIMPLLGKHGLAFTAKPTIADGEFVLAYKLVHSSGEMDEGFYLLPSPKTTDPQKVGSAITYARRYCLCSVTGIAPDGEDDDAAAAQAGHRQSAADAFENATPARPQGNGNGGQVSRPAAAAQSPAAETGELDEGAQEYADQAHEARTVTELEEIHKRAREAGKVAAVIRNPSTGKTGKLALYIDWRRKSITEADAALTELNTAATARNMDILALEAHVKNVTGADIESATTAQLRDAAKALVMESAA